MIDSMENQGVTGDHIFSALARFPLPLTMTLSPVADFEEDEFVNEYNRQDMQ